MIYARYSTDSQREESIEGQIRECTAYAEKNGFTVKLIDWLDGDTAGTFSFYACPILGPASGVGEGVGISILPTLLS